MGGKRSSGATHARYAHATRPTAIALACPRCGAMALATQPSHARGRRAVSDCSPEWREPWRIVCEGCPWRAKDLDYDAVRAAGPLYFAVEVQGVELWAFDREHLELIADALEGRPVEGHPLRIFSTYLRRGWLSRSRRPAFAKAARAMLERAR